MNPSGYQKDTIIIYAVGIIGIVATILLYYNHFFPEWKSHQREFIRQVDERLGPQRASAVQTGIRQVYVRELSRTDRCVTCHLGIEWQGMENAPHPFRTHPREILEAHPVAEYGCTICHGGQGYALNREDAHGLIEHWDDPLLGSDIESLYRLTDRNILMQMNCNTCHRFDTSTPGAEYINIAKEIVREKNCRACHNINGRGGVIGPDLTNVGEKLPDQVDYARLVGRESLFNWHLLHYRDPRMITPETVMPSFGFTPKEITALTLLTLSWKNVTLPPRYYPQTAQALADFPSPEELERERAMREGEGAFFVEKGCFVCHSVSSFRVEAAAEIGPDLARARDNIRRRLGVTVDQFIREPVGTMAVVFGSQIILSEAEKDRAIQLLHQANDKLMELQRVSREGE
jgi:cbb3-type cytochrome oxidase cytochrome c subunit